MSSMVEIVAIVLDKCFKKHVADYDIICVDLFFFKNNNLVRKWFVHTFKYGTFTSTNEFETLSRWPNLYNFRWVLNWQRLYNRWGRCECNIPTAIVDPCIFVIGTRREVTTFAIHIIAILVVPVNTPRSESYW